MSAIKKINKSYFVIFALLIALLLRLFNLNYEGLWNDELFTADMAAPHRSFVDMLLFVQKFDIHPPLHNVLSKIWSHLFSYNDTSLRVFNILIGVWGVKSVYDLAKYLFTNRTAWYALGFAVINYYLIRYSQEVRSYALLFLLTNYSFYYFLKLIREEFRWTNAIGYVAITTSMLYTHYFALFAIGVQFVAFLSFMDWSEFKKKTLRYVLTFAVPCLLFLFWLPVLLNGLGKNSTQWRDEATWDLLIRYAQDFFNDYLLSTTSVVLIGLTLLYFILRKFFKLKFFEKMISSDRFALHFVIIWIVVYFGTPFLKSVFSETMMVNRYFICLVTPIILLLSFYMGKIKLESVRNGMFGVIIGYSLLVLFLKDSPYYTRTTTFREIASTAKQIDPDAPVLYLSNNPRYFEYYLRQNLFRQTRKQPNVFSKLISASVPQRYFVFLDLRPIPKKYRQGIPVMPDYELSESWVLKNKAGINSTQLLQYVRVTDTVP